MHRAEFDAGMLKVGDLKGAVMGDDIESVQQAEHSGTGAEEIDHRDPIAAAIGLDQSDSGAMRIERGGLGVFDLRLEELVLGLERGDLGTWGLCFLGRPQLAIEGGLPKLERPQPIGFRQTSAPSRCRARSAARRRRRAPPAARLPLASAVTQ